METKKPMEKFDLLKFMVEGITDRDAPTLYNETPERDLYTLWMDKVDCCDSSEDLAGSLTEAGQKLRELLPQLIPGQAFRMAFAQKKEMPFIRALLDAVSVKEGELLVARLAVLSPEEFALVAYGKIPRRYWIELQHQMICLGAEKGKFIATVSGVEAGVVEVDYDLVFASNHIAECIQFWDCVRRAVPPKNAITPTELDPYQKVAKAALESLNRPVSLVPPPDQL